MKAETRSGLLHLAVIFVVWGSTYLAIRVAVEPGEHAGGFAPMWMGALRMALAGGALLAFAWWRGLSLRLPTEAWPTVAIGGLLVWAGGNGLVMIAETRVSSSVAALVAATTPAWVVVLESLLDLRLPSRRTVVAMTIGLVGVGVLQTDPNAPAWTSSSGMGPIAGLLFAALCFAAGTITHKRYPVKGPVTVRAGWELLLATGGFVTLALARDEPMTMPHAEAWLAFGYLVVVGSIIGFTSFVKATERLPTSLVSTHAFVNPIVAVALGWGLLNERITWRTGLSASLILVSVLGLLRKPNVGAELTSPQAPRGPRTRRRRRALRRSA